MILFKNTFEGTTIKVEILAGQKVLKGSRIPLEDIRITAPYADIGKFPTGTIFATNGYDFPEEDHLYMKKENIVALVFENPGTGELKAFNLEDPGTGKLREGASVLIDYLVDYMLDNSENGLEEAKKYADLFAHLGYTVDFDKKLEEGESVNLKRTISAKYPVPKKEDIGFHVDPELWFLLVRNVLRGENTMLIGDTGTGE